MRTWLKGTPVIDANGKVIAQVRNELAMSGDSLYFTWFVPKSNADLVAGPPTRPDNTPVNQANVHEVFRKSDYVILSVQGVPEDEYQDAFNSRNSYFKPVHEKIDESWAGKLKALNVLRDDLIHHDPTIDAKLDYLKRYYEHRLKRENR